MAGHRAGLLADRAGTPLIEFALVAPVLLVLLMGAYDASTALICWHRTVATAQQIVKIATELSIQPDQTTSLTPYQAFQAGTAVFAANPQLRAGAVPFSVLASAVVFTASPDGCKAGACTYTASTAWSVPLTYGGYTYGGQQRRPCGTLAQVDPAAPQTFGNVPTKGMTALTSLVVVDVSQVFTPLFARFLAPAITMSSTAMLVPRIGGASQYVQYDVAGANAHTDLYVCPGFL